MAAVTTAQIEGIRTGAQYNVSSGFEAVDSFKPRFKVGYITAPTTTDDADTIEVDLYEQFGILVFKAVIGFIHTTEDSVIVEEAPTTAVNGTKLTLTVGGSTDNKKRFYVVYGL